MSHPNNRAERRLARSNTIRSATKKAKFLHWYSQHCTCWPTGSWLRQGCDLHGEKDSKNDRRIGRWAKTGPYNWIFHMEHDYYASGLLRQAYRSGGGRRYGTDDWGGGMHDAGRFDLNKALNEWDEIDNYASVLALASNEYVHNWTDAGSNPVGGTANDSEWTLPEKLAAAWNRRIRSAEGMGWQKIRSIKGRRNAWNRPSSQPKVKF